MIRRVLSDLIWEQLQAAKAATGLIHKVVVVPNFIADKSYESEAIRDELRQAGINPVIPRTFNGKKPNLEFDAYLYKLRHLVENLFARLKHFRSIATRYDKLARNFKVMVYLACTFIWIRMR